MTVLKVISLLLTAGFGLVILCRFNLCGKIPRTISRLTKISTALIGITTFSPGFSVYLLLSVPSGIAYLFLMILINSPMPPKEGVKSMNLIEWFKTLLYLPHLYRREFFGSFIEELIWRGGFVFIFASAGIPVIWIIILGSFGFYLVHMDIDSRIVISAEIELLLFSLLLYVIYINTDSFISVWIIHFLRNSFLKFRELFFCYA